MYHRNSSRRFLKYPKASSAFWPSRFLFGSLDGLCNKVFLSELFPRPVVPLEGRGIRQPSQKIRRLVALFHRGNAEQKRRAARRLERYGIRGYLVKKMLGKPTGRLHI